MKEGYVIRNQTLPHFITATVVDCADVFYKENVPKVRRHLRSNLISKNTLRSWGHVHTYWDNTTGSLEISGMEHLGLGIGELAGINISLPLRAYYNFFLK